MCIKQHDDGQDHERRTRMVAAAITGVLSGIIRAVASWLLDQLTTNK